MKRSAIVIASVLALAGASAQAFTDTWSDLSQAYDNSVSYGRNGLSFTDTVNFTLTGLSDVSVTVGSTGLSNAVFSLYMGGSLLESTDITGKTVVVAPYTSLAAGAYSFVVSGTVNSKPGVYNLNANVAAVPEPETYALMLAGLGAVGFMARRRKSA
ncbi:FxDxF family PEP-CTERM protein [Aquincola tertiaricarbonis]|uniref:FxDxF family PEP-CTERM protein n=1 Tax=Aquincola tertiaricarbonis TaxID=391953 RepID=A0ABY4SEI4_AQUTE|nr:FxDxF family PEP-CTERM protein [Aquincola tertiaricarbonis]URI10332.1 FxDxF family PEP-CTERM protein [Aquincola tertiaricarbonis]